MPAKFLALVAKHPIRMLDKESSAGARVAKDMLREPACGIEHILGNADEEPGAIGPGRLELAAKLPSTDSVRPEAASSPGTSA